MGQLVCRQQDKACHSVVHVNECCNSCDQGGEGGAVRVEHQLLASIVNGETDKADQILSSGPQGIVNCRLQVPLSDGTYMCYSDGATPLHLASLLGQQDLVMSLLEKRAQADISDSRGHTPAFYAQRGQHEGIQRLLQERITGR